MPDNGSEMRACSGLPELWRSIHQRVGYRRIAQRCRRAGQDGSAGGDSTIRSGLISFARQVYLAAPPGERPQAACSRARGCPLVRACGPAWRKSPQARTAWPIGGGQERSLTTNGRWGCPALLPAACKDHNLQLAKDRAAKKSLCVLCALCVSVVKLLVVKL